MGLQRLPRLKLRADGTKTANTEYLGLAPNGKIKGGADCHTACDHFHRVKEDVALMKELGLKSYRFSISWSRIQPRENEINKKGLNFYINLVDELRKANIDRL